MRQRGVVHSGWWMGRVVPALVGAIFVANTGAPSSAQPRFGPTSQPQVPQLPQPPTNLPPMPPPVPPVGQRIYDAIQQTAPRGQRGPGARDPEVQKRYDELRDAGVPQPTLKYIGDLPPDVRNMFPRSTWDNPVPNLVEDPDHPGVYRPNWYGTVSTNRGVGLGLSADDVSGWMHFWEPNRERYWPKRSGAPVRDVAPVPPRVLTALKLASASKDPTTRAQVALALAMVKHPEAMELLPKLTGDSSDGVAMHAWAAIGLMNTPAASKHLESPPKGQRNVIGWTLAVGLSDKPTEVMWRAMPRVVDESRAPEAQRLALWAMRRHEPAGSRELLLRAINGSTDPVLLTEALRGLAKFNQREDVANLINAARGNFDGITWDYVIPVNNTVRGRARIGGPTVSQRAAGARKFQAPALVALADMDSPTAPVLETLREEFRELVNIALGNTRVVRVLKYRQMLSLPDGRVVYGRRGNPIALLALSRQPGGDDVELAKGVLEDAESEEARMVLHPSNAVRPAGRPGPDPLRDEAALGLGLYLYNGGLTNEGGAVSNSTGRPIPTVVNGLTVYYQDATESPHVRAACAVALGLAGDKTFAVRIKQGMERMTPGQELVWGFAIRALGMLGDPEAVDLAGRYIGPAREMVDVDALLAREAPPAAMEVNELIARRAAVDGLAALGDPRALPFLYGEWGKNPFLDLEIARAIARCRKVEFDSSPPGAPDPFIEAMVRLVVQERNPDLAASAAVALGALWEDGQRARLGELIAGAAPIPANGRIQGGRIDLTKPAPETILSLGNPFYYLVLRQSK